ncbi:chemotaxis protein CheB [Gemmata sp. JC673]|uniref:protein-glutamate methylesterase n=1 Tax=Gemmata algarum TaxID=2975278 RepID=A0ABU5F1X3_9BACT|nr:chemotaxis protein CheB [Gemmata algarum]MDY3559859.1 chemotaxis protein CheB [Gemmata algarum]
MSAGAEAVVIGASAGAVDALSAVLPALPKGYPLPVMVVVHLPPDKKSVMAELFRGKCAVDVREADDKEPLTGGTVYFAPPDYHLLVEPDRRLSLSSEEQVHFSRPSVDVLFESAADVFGPGLVGVVLTGANADGARGLRAVLAAGGIGLVQAPTTAAATAMPLAALAAHPAARALTLDQIAAHLRELGGTS